jgi:succinate dehydrogenase flavin-adding protein (antitoxin of CptAB toxin-antitoxin module)
MAMGTSVLSLRIDHELLQRLRHHAAKRGMSVQDYVVRTLVRDDFDERFQTAVEETERFYGSPDPGDEDQDQDQDQVRPSAGIR